MATHLFKSDELEIADHMLLSVHSYHKKMVDQLEIAYLNQRAATISQLAKMGRAPTERVLNATKKLKDTVYLDL